MPVPYMRGVSLTQATQRTSTDIGFDLDSFWGDAYDWPAAMHGQFFAVQKIITNTLKRFIHTVYHTLWIYAYQTASVLDIRNAFSVISGLNILACIIKEHCFTSTNHQVYVMPAASVIWLKLPCQTQCV